MAVLIEEFHRAGAAIAELGHGAGDDHANVVALGLVEGRGGGLLEDLLVAALDRAVALPEMTDIAVLVGDDLDLDMARALKVFFQIDRIVAKGGAGLRLGGLHRDFEFLFRACDLHAATAAAGSGLYQHRIADLLGDLLGRGYRIEPAIGARHAGHASLDHGLLGRDLVAHHADMLRLRADEDEVVSLDHLGELGIFRQEAIAGMDGIGAGDLGRGDDLGLLQVGLARRRRPDAHALIGQPHRHGVGIGFGMDRHGCDAHFLAGAVDAQGNLAAVGDQDFLDHSGRSLS